MNGTALEFASLTVSCSKLVVPLVPDAITTAGPRARRCSRLFTSTPYKWRYLFTDSKERVTGHSNAQDSMKNARF